MRQRCSHPAAFFYMQLCGSGCEGVEALARKGEGMDAVDSARWSRRSCLGLAAAWALAGNDPAHAQNQAKGQLEEPLADSVRTALSSAVGTLAPPEPVFASTEARMQYLRWLTQMSERLQRRKADWQVRRDFLQTVWYEAKRAGLDVSLVMGLIQVESAFRKYAISVVGARGYMQVMPFWTRTIGDADNGKLFHMQTNLRYGCVILRHYIDRERGDLFMALGRYNGSRGRDKYPNAVYAAQRNWVFEEVPTKV